MKRSNLYTVNPNDTILHFLTKGSFGSISPDGHYITYTSTEAGQSQIYLQSLSAGSRKLQVSDEDGAEESRWSGKGDKIIYRSGQKWMEVEVRFSPILEVSKPKKFFEGNYMNVGGYSYDISKIDGKFLLVKGSDERESNQIAIVQGWFEELKKLMSHEWQ